MIRLAVSGCVLLCLALVVGCADSKKDSVGPESSGSADSTPKVGSIGKGNGGAEKAAKSEDPDDAASVTALADLEAKLKKDGDGFVTEVNFRGLDVDDTALTHLAGLPHLKSLVLQDTEITDAGLETVGKISAATGVGTLSRPWMRIPPPRAFGCRERPNSAQGGLERARGGGMRSRGRV